MGYVQKIVRACNIVRVGKRCTNTYLAIGQNQTCCEVENFGPAEVMGTLRTIYL